MLPMDSFSSVIGAAARLPANADTPVFKGLPSIAGSSGATLRRASLVPPIVPQNAASAARSRTEGVSPVITGSTMPFLTKPRATFLPIALAAAGVFDAIWEAPGILLAIAPNGPSSTFAQAQYERVRA